MYRWYDSYGHTRSPLPFPLVAVSPKRDTSIVPSLWLFAKGLVLPWNRP